MPTPRTRRPATNIAAAKATVDALRAQERVTPLDEARVMNFLTLAAAIDACPDDSGLRREYRFAESQLRQTEDTAADAFDQLAARLSAPVRHAEDA